MMGHLCGLQQEPLMPATIDHQLAAAWTAERDAMDSRLAPHFGRAEVRTHARAYLRAPSFGHLIIL
jgi:hypothetical protein